MGMCQDVLSLPNSCTVPPSLPSSLLYVCPSLSPCLTSVAPSLSIYLLSLPPTLPYNWTSLFPWLTEYFLPSLPVCLTLLLSLVCVYTCLCVSVYVEGRRGSPVPSSLPVWTLLRQIFKSCLLPQQATDHIACSHEILFTILVTNMPSVVLLNRHVWKINIFAYCTKYRG